MLIRRNWHREAPKFIRSRLGLLIITKRWVFATKTYAYVWEI